ncbi:MAG: VCBS repeat-containing protein, partial [Desulfovibrio sp.]|nr:VCBS repeat-containing protein [Desulfovibrio sp.]
MKLTVHLSLLIIAVLLAAPACGASMAASRIFVISPFAVNAPQSYAYLSKALPASLQTKLTRPSSLEARPSQSKIASQSDAKKALASSGADFAVWGTVSVTGNECTVEINSMDKAGKLWTKVDQGLLSALNATI